MVDCPDEGLETWSEGLVAGLVTVVLGFLSAETPVDGRLDVPEGLFWFEEGLTRPVDGLVWAEGLVAAGLVWVDGRVAAGFLSDDEDELLLTVPEERPED